jgi:2-C-methyl-D-erythritol 4-phosphate cytidylyltransferase
MKPAVWTVVVAAGQSIRFGTPKLLEPLGGRRVIDHALAAAGEWSDGVVLVTDDPAISSGQVVDRVVSGGSTRSESVRAGLAAVPSMVEIVLVHDAARPLAPVELFEAVAAALVDGVDAVVPAVAVVDTIKRVDARGLVVETLNRSELVAVQTPQAFRRAALEAAHLSGGEATDDAALIEQAGGTVVTVKGSATNIKVTEPRDLEFMRSMYT